MTLKNHISYEVHETGINNNSKAREEVQSGGFKLTTAHMDNLQKWANIKCKSVICSFILLNRAGQLSLFLTGGNNNTAPPPATTTTTTNTVLYTSCSLYHGLSFITTFRHPYPRGVQYVIVPGGRDYTIGQDCVYVQDVDVCLFL